MSNIEFPRIRKEIRQLFRSEADERVREVAEKVEEQSEADVETDDEVVVTEVAEVVEKEKQDIEEEIEMPLGDIIRDGEMQPFESSDVSMAEIQRSLNNLETAQETLAKKAMSYESAYQTLMEEADPNTYTEEEIIASRLHKNRVFFETMLHLLNDVGELVEETVKMLEQAVSNHPEQIGVGEVLGEEDREAIAEEINQKEQEKSFGISSRDKLDTGVKGGIGQDRKALREASGGIDPVETVTSQAAREILGGGDEDEDEDKDEDIGLAF